MKKIILCCILYTFGAAAFCQKETFDMVTYTPPNNWQKDVTETITSYTIVNKTDKSWCRINIVKSTISKGNIEQDFDSEWQELIVKNYTPTETPQLNEVQDADGWKIKSGSTKFKFNNVDAIAMLTTASGFNRCVSIVTVTNNPDYLKDITAFISTVELIKPLMNTQQATTNTDDDKHAILGTWCITSSDLTNIRINNGVINYISRQYTLKENGNYTCNTKTFDPLMNTMFLGRETGTYKIEGNTLSIIPQKSVLEEWSKKDGKDDWGKLLKSQNITLEKITYQFTKNYNSYVKEWQLILQASKQTKRDGPFNNNEHNGWIYVLTSPSHPIINLPN